MSYIYDYFSPYIDILRRIVCWDLETNGKDGFKGYIQPTQLGVLVQDTSLNIISENNLNCTLLPYNVIHPEALQSAN